MNIPEPVKGLFRLIGGMLVILLFVYEVREIEEWHVYTERE